MTPLKLFVLGRELELQGWVWETWSGSFADQTAKGWWFKRGEDGVMGMRRGDPKPYDQATISTHNLYKEAVK